MREAARLCWAVTQICCCATASCTSSATSDRATDSSACDAAAPQGSCTSGSENSAGQGNTSSVVRFAAIQYGPGDYLDVPRAETSGEPSTCQDDLCGLTYYVRKAAAQGAEVVVTSEYALSEYNVARGVTEPTALVGSYPATDPSRAAGDALHDFAQLADELDLVVVLNDLVVDAAKGSAVYNASFAFDAAGAVLARHYKFELYETEVDTLTRGDDLTSSFFSTRAGLVGMLICADVQCTRLDREVGTYCTEHASTLTAQFFDVYQPRIVLLSSWWISPSTDEFWSPEQTQSYVAGREHVYLVAANTTAAPGQGGGIFDGDGAELIWEGNREPSIVWWDIPK